MAESPSSRTALFRRMRWEEVREAARERRVALVPVAAIEQHGPHLPVDTDNLAVETVCELASERRPDLLICLPPIHYGFNRHNMDFPGTINWDLTREAFAAVRESEYPGGVNHACEY